MLNYNVMLVERKKKITIWENKIISGSKGSLISSSVDAAAAAEYGRALSLLSSNSWDESSILFHHHQLHENSSTSNSSIHHHHPMIYEGVPSSSSEFWPTPHNVQSLAAFKSSPSPSSYDVADIYSNLLNWPHSICLSVEVSNSLTSFQPCLLLFCF